MKMRAWLDSLSGIVIGVVTLALVSALLVAAVAAYNAAESAQTASRQLTAVNQQLRANDKESDRRSAIAKHERADLMNRAQLLQWRLNVLVKLLQARSAVTVVPGTRPTPVPPNPGTQHHPTPRPNSKPPEPSPPAPTFDVCALLPTLCELTQEAP